MENMDYIDEFFSSLSPEEMQYAKSCMSRMGDKMGKGPNVEIEIETEGEEPNESDSEEFTNGKGPNNEAKGDGNSTVPKSLAKAKKGEVPLKEAEMFGEEE
jgi:hypothetical protein